MSRKIGKLIEIIINIITILLVGVLILAGTYMFQTKVLNRDYADVFGYTVFKVATGSMEPTISTEDIVIVKLTNDVAVDEIIVFKDNENIITHRLINIENENYTTKGDANNSEDKEINKNQVIGKVVNTIHNVGVWKKVLFTPEVFITLTIAIILFVVAFSYKGKEDDDKKDKEGKIEE